MNNTLVLMMGIPGSGKSTIATRLAKKKDIYTYKEFFDLLYRYDHHI